ncbi:TPA: ATP-binding protein [Vibrio parahaemolyticus]|uniref:AAA family ATPase n=1 Tax=Vibrio diabolicus TaxID=50719 RepID=UPI00215EC4FA|nr:ATP-binding protein [Vibrio diabolicus]MCS0451657.1 ATP-binding protein [Vibrio diabolicus]HAV1570685.1 ATP-binding protein [Vibrio parahaemolyticus]HAV1979029.1 ATP-binding protein [Vibrio parahaemolyticus]
MLLTFKVSNFKGFASEQILDLVATSKSEFSELLRPITSQISVNKNACIIGPNGSGKSQILDSIYRAARCIKNNELKELSKPFILDDNSASSPTSVELLLFSKKLDIFINYSFSVFKGLVVNESLQVKNSQKSSKLKTIFSREGDEISFSSGYKEQANLITGNITQKSLVASYGAGIKLKEIQEIYYWAERTFILNTSTINNQGPYLINSLYDYSFSTKEEEKAFVSFNQKLLKETTKFLNSFDIPIREFQLKENLKGEKYLTFIPKSNSKEDIVLTFSEAKDYFSEGTFNTIIITLLVGFLSLGNTTLLLDEIDGPLHHKLTIALLDFIRATHQKNNSQFIISSHDIMVLDHSFRRDAIFAISKNENYHSEIRRASEFSLRKDAKMSIKYLQNEFGSLPNILESYT